MHRGLNPGRETTNLREMKTGSKTCQPVKLIKCLCDNLAGTCLPTFVCQRIYVRNSVPLCLTDGLKSLALNAMAQDRGYALQATRWPIHREIGSLTKPQQSASECTKRPSKRRTWGTVAGDASRDAEQAKHAKAEAAAAAALSATTSIPDKVAGP